MEGTCKEKTVFICSYETVQFESMPFELMNSQEMEHLFLNLEHAKCYVDDAGIVSKIDEDQKQMLGKVVGQLQEIGLRLRIKKCYIKQNKRIVWNAPDEFQYMVSLMHVR